MKASIRDVGALSAIRPLDLASYLRSKGWSQESSRPGVSAVWILKDYEILVPIGTEFRDFALRVGEVLSTVARAEDRSELEVYRDVSTASFDLVRVRAVDPDYASGTIPVAQGVELVEHARDLMLSAACAAKSPRPIFHTRKPNEAVDYLSRVRLGQTEVGSFVVAILAPVPPALQTTIPTVEPGDDPFERKVTKTLTRSLNAALGAAQQSATGSGLEAFDDAVRDGVSANLCDALVGIHEASRAHGVMIGVNWAAVRPPGPNLPPVRISIPSDAINIIREASRVFRETRPDPDVEVRGYIVRLDRNEGEMIGHATIYGIVNGAPRRVRVELMGRSYDQVVDAHKRELEVTVVGELRKEGRGYSLKNPHDLTIEQPEDDS